jgi:hypothetical protein
MTTEIFGAERKKPSIGVLPILDRDHNYQNFSRIDRVKKPVIPDAIPVKMAQISFEFFYVRAEKGIVTQLRVYIIPYFLV